MTYYSSSGTTSQKMANTVIAVKPLDIIVGHPTTKNMNITTEKMAKMVAAIKTTAWEGKHGSLSLVLENLD